jgi:hypothetical protein
MFEVFIFFLFFSSEILFVEAYNYHYVLEHYDWLSSETLVLLTAARKSHQQLRLSIDRFDFSWESIIYSKKKETYKKKYLCDTTWPNIQQNINLFPTKSMSFSIYTYIYISISKRKWHHYH